MAVKTPKLGLNKPGTGEYGWDALLGQNIDILDAYVGQLLDERAVSGNATGGSATTLVDSGAAWGTNAFAGAIVVVRRNGVLLRAEKISSNTATTLTLAASGAAIAAGDQYVILAQANAIPNSEKGAPNGVATLDANGQVPTTELGNAVLASEKGAANGVATLDASGILTGAQLGASSLAVSGYQKLPSGMIMQWGTFILPGAGLNVVTFPIAFQTAVYGIWGQAECVFGNGGKVVLLTANTTADFLVGAALNTTDAWSSGDKIFWLAMGH